MVFQVDQPFEGKGIDNSFQGMSPNLFCCCKNCFPMSQGFPCFPAKFFGLDTFFNPITIYKDINSLYEQ
jgi:hypothetical protein